MSAPIHRTPRIYPLHRSAVTSLQVLNVLMLAWWTYLLGTHYEAYRAVPQMAALRLLGNVYWWGWATGIILLMNALPFVPWWALNVNRTYILKRFGLIASAMWWSFLAAVFWFVALDIGVGIHAVLALACLFESARLMRAE